MKPRYVFINKKNFLAFLKRLPRTYRLIVPQGNDDYFFEEFKGEFSFNKYRPTTSLRQFLIPSCEHLNSYFANPPITEPRLKASLKGKKPFCIVGVKNCDLHSLRIQDFVFLEEDFDPSYKFMRDNNLLISSDCTAFRKVCFCLALDLKPYPKKLFDLNLSKLENGYLVEIGSDKGLKTIDENKDLFREMKDVHLREQEYNRKVIVEILTSYLKPQKLPSADTLYNLIKNNYENEIWKDEALKCVECGACIMNCPTCHCFLLFDTQRENNYLRGRVWDGCQYKNFTRVAGEANPLKIREKRLRNRYIKKFEFFHDNLDLYACTGCGRCIEGCIAKIDLREIFKKLVK